MLLSKTQVAAAGFAVAASVFFVGGLLLLCLGLLGEYVGRVYDEVRSRPLSIVNTIHRSPAANAPHIEIVAAQSNGDANPEGIEAA
jgi:hypothetical protein